jgi:hypothetical protein
MFKIKFIHVLILSAFLLSSTAAYFSVTGLAKMFTGAFTSVLVMMSSLELAKLVTASYLYRYWDEINKAFKTYLVIGVIVLMVITSSGIYGYLSEAYSVTSSKIEKIDNQISLLNKKKEIIINKNGRIKESVLSKENRISTLSNLRTNQESRIDTLYKRGQVANARKTEAAIIESSREIESLRLEINKSDNINQSNLDSISKIDIEVLNLQSSDINGEIGPLKYISKLTNKSIDDVVNFFILLLIFVFDPLAIALVIAVNKIQLKEKEEDKIVNKEHWFYKTKYTR